MSNRAVATPVGKARGHRLWVVAALFVGTVLIASGARAQAGPGWASLTTAQKAALQPLEKDWAGIDAPRKQKWIEVAMRFDRMSPEERERTQARMGEWVRLSPTQRNDARANFQSARQMSPEERQQRWEAYRALSEDERQDLAARSKVKPAALTPPARVAAPAGGPKVNTVPTPSAESRRPKTATPGLAQAKPGATTTPIAVRPTPPAHQQPGLPKVAATPEFVDKKTLLPQAGAQAEAVEPRTKR